MSELGGSPSTPEPAEWEMPSPDPQYVGRAWMLGEELLKVLDDVEVCIRMADTERLMKVAFIWSQNRDAILERRTTWAQQTVNLMPPKLGGVR